MNMTMTMSFWWGHQFKNFLFYGYNITSNLELVLTCLLLFTLAVIIEGLRVLQAKHRQRDIFLRSKQLQTICPAQELTLIDGERQMPRITMKQRLFLFSWELFAWLNLQILSLLLMLSVMGFNGWMFVSIALGSGIGYYIFGTCLMKINLQNFEIIRGTFCVLDEQMGESTPIMQATPAISSSSMEGSLQNCH